MRLVVSLDIDPVAHSARVIEVLSTDVTFGELAFLTGAAGLVSVWVTAKGTQWIQVIKAIRALDLGLTRTGLKEAKEQSEGLYPVAKDVTLDVANRVKSELEAQGATVEIRA